MSNIEQATKAEAENVQLRDALQRLERCFQADWPTINVKVRLSGYALWIQAPVDDETRDAILHARMYLKPHPQSEVQRLEAENRQLRAMLGMMGEFESGQ